MCSAAELTAQLEAQRRAAKEQEERLEAEIKALQRQEAEEAEKKRLEEERLRKEVEEKLRREAEEKVRREAEEKKQRDAEEEEKLKLQFRGGLMDVGMDVADSEWVPLSPWSRSQVMLPILEAEQGGVAEGSSATPVRRRKKLPPCYNCKLHETPCERPE
jgi:hypothetical protein